MLLTLLLADREINVLKDAGSSGVVDF